jgi:hypothetical protein
LKSSWYETESTAFHDFVAIGNPSFVLLLGLAENTLLVGSMIGIPGSVQFCQVAREDFVNKVDR